MIETIEPHSMGRTIYKRLSAHTATNLTAANTRGNANATSASAANASAAYTSVAHASALHIAAPMILPHRRRETRPRRLLLCLDGVPHSVIAAAQARGMFGMFRAPTRLLSPFPTMTNIALSTMLKATAPAGYESLYFDSHTRRLAGGISKYVGTRTEAKKPSSYMDELDYQEPLPCEFLVYFAPEKICFADFHRFAARLRGTPPQNDFFAFLKATDGLLHIRGADRLQNALIELDHILRDMRSRYGDETEIILFSDHGMCTEEHRRVKLRKHLEAHCYKWLSRMDGEDEQQVVVPAFGLCGYVALYSQNENAANKIAHDLATLEGIDFSLTREGTSAVVTSLRGVARIHCRREATQKSYAYEQLTGDPLALAAIRNEMEAAGRADASGYATEDAWYEATEHHIYPDALANLYGAIFDSRVEHTADVLVSLHDGYYYGATLFGHLARRLLATHGNARAESSTAFLMSTHRNFPETVRACKAEPLLRG